MSIKEIKMNFIEEGDFYFCRENDNPYLLASSFKSSLRDDEIINNKLKEIAYKGIVYVDMLLTKGATPTRFMECYFDGTKFQIRKTKILDNKEKIKKLIKIEQLFFNQNKYLIERSTLSQSEKLIAFGKNY